MWLQKIANRTIIDQVLVHLSKLPGKWRELQRSDTGMGESTVGKPVREWNLGYEVRGIKMPYDMYSIVVWLQIGSNTQPDTLQFNLQHGHKDVAFEVMVLAPINRRDDESALTMVGSTKTELHTPAEVAEFVFQTIDKDKPDDNDPRETGPRPSRTPEFAPVGMI